MKLKINERQLRKLVQPAMDSIAAEYEATAERISRTMKDAPVSAIVAELEATVARMGGNVDKQTLTDWAQVLKDGGTINFRS